MDVAQYRAALRDRGFHYLESMDKWVGPFNIIITGWLNNDLRPSSFLARVESIAVIDEQLRAAREGPRPQSFGGPGPGLL